MKSPSKQDAPRDSECDYLPDDVDDKRAQWRRELPRLNTEPMAVFGRAYRVTLRVRRDVDALFLQHGLDAGTFDVLATLRRSGHPFRLRPTDLYKQLMISSGGMTDRLARLEATGYIRRIAAASGDGRSLPVQLTASGQKVVEKAFSADMAMEEKLLLGLTDAERLQLAALLKKLAESIEA